MLQNGLKKDFCDALKNPKLELIKQIDDFAIPLYYEEMKIDRMESQVKMGNYRRLQSF